MMSSSEIIKHINYDIYSYKSQIIYMPKQDIKRLPKEQLIQIGRRMKELRGVHVNQADFAKELGITQSMLSRLERAQTEPSLAILVKLSEITGKSLDYIVKGDD